MQKDGAQGADDLRAHWESVGADYTAEWDPPARARLGERELDFIVEGLRGTAGRRALDVGIGSGRILADLVRRTDKTDFYGIDIAQAMVDASRARLGDEPRIRDLQVCDIAREPIPFGDTFDFVSAIRMLKYNPNWREILGKLVAALEPGGGIVFSMTNRNGMNRISREYAVHWDTATKAELEQVCRQELGLEVLAVTGFTKLPHAFYSRAKAPWLAKGLLGIDATLDRVIGAPTLAREIFVSARRA